MHYFTPAKSLPEGSIYLTDLTHVANFADWLAEFETLLNQNPRFATVCTPMRRQVSDEQRIADRKTYNRMDKGHTARNCPNAAPPCSSSNPMKRNWRSFANNRPNSPPRWA